MTLRKENLKQDNGFQLRNANRLIALKRDRDEKLEKSEKLDKEVSPLYPPAIEARGEFDEADKAYREFEKLLMSGESFLGDSVKDFEYVPDGIYFSLGDINGRNIVDKNRVRIVTDSNYNITECAEIVPEGTAGSAKPALLSVVKTENADSFNFEDIRAVAFTVYEDDKDNIVKAFDYNHKVAFVNAENKKAFELLLTAKDAISLSAENMQETINANLCGKAKQKAIIVTNKTGFAKLDKDVNGIPLVTKDGDGNFIYKNKYVIKEMPDEILPNTDNGESPVIIADLSIVEFFLQRETYLEKDDFLTFNQLDRGIRKEIIKLSTTSDEAYIHGLLA